MKKFAVQKLAEIIKAGTTKNIESFFSGVSTDSRTIKPGQCFFAIAGENFDGADFLGQAFREKAACAVVNNDVDTRKFSERPILKVEDTLEALGEFAKYRRKEGMYKVIAITGSVGKTTTRNIIAQVLSRHYRTSQSPKNFNTLTGLPLSILTADLNDQILVLEMGTNQPGEIAALSKIASPDIALITNVEPSHLAGFGSLEVIAAEKLSITEGLKPGGTLLLNADCEKLVRAAGRRKLNFSTFGTSRDAQIRAKNVVLKPFSSTFYIDDKKIYLPIPGFGAVQNAIAAWAVCKRCGININSFAENMKSVSPLPLRLELLQIEGLTVLSDCYNANPASMKNALEILKNMNKEEKKRLVFICGDMAELGKQEAELHRELGFLIADTGVNLLLTIGNLARTAAETAKKQARCNLKTKSFEDTLSACNNLADYIKKDDIILLKGSRKNNLELVLEKLKTLFTKS